MKPYLPIDCSYYDRLEAWATLKQTCVIRWMEQDGHRQEIKSKINDLLLKDGVEYLLADNNLIIRLDQLISVNGIPLTNGSCTA